MNFTYSVEEKGPVTLLHLTGSLIERSQAEPLIKDVDKQLSAGRNLFVLDLGAFEYMNSSGLGVLINLLTKTRSRDGEIVIIQVNNKIRELLIITKLITVFKVSEDWDAAFAELSKN